MAAKTFLITVTKNHLDEAIKDTQRAKLDKAFRNGRSTPCFCILAKAIEEAVGQPVWRIQYLSTDFIPSTKNEHNFNFASWSQLSNEGTSITALAEYFDAGRLDHVKTLLPMTFTITAFDA